MTSPNSSLHKLECFCHPKERVLPNTACQDSPLGLALLTRPPVRLWVMVGTGAKGFSGLPNQSPALNVSLAPGVLRSPGPLKVWAELQRKPQLNSSENRLGGCSKPLREGSWHHPSELTALYSLLRDDQPTPATAPAVAPSHWARLAPQQLRGDTLSSELVVETVSWPHLLLAGAAPPEGQGGGRDTCLLILTLPTSV